MPSTFMAPRIGRYRLSRGKRSRRRCRNSVFNAEGIETREQLDRLRTLRCGLGQGFYLARPKGVPAAEVFLPHVPVRPVRKAG